MKNCPNCKKDYTSRPALSRKDNKTEICPDCGMSEAMTEFTNSEYVTKTKPDDYRVFGRRRVSKNSCNVEFNIRLRYLGANKNVSPTDLTVNTVGVTHYMLHDMLIGCASIIRENDSAEAPFMGEIDMGNGISIEIWEKQK